jgi:hypothetical protein
VAFPLEIVLELGRIHVVGALVDVDEGDVRAGLGNGFGGGNEGMRDGDDGVALLDPRSHQGKAHGIRAAGETDAMGRVAILGKFAFELFHQGAADEARGTKNLPTNGEQFGFELDVRGDQIQERDFFVA